MMKLILALLSGSSLLPSLGDRDSAKSSLETVAEATQLTLSSKTGKSHVKAQVASAVNSNRSAKGLHRAAKDRFEEDDFLQEGEEDEGQDFEEETADNFDQQLRSPQEVSEVSEVSGLGDGLEDQEELGEFQEHEGEEEGSTIEGLSTDSQIHRLPKQEYFEQSKARSAARARESGEHEWLQQHLEAGDRSLEDMSRVDKSAVEYRSTKDLSQQILDRLKSFKEQTWNSLIESTAKTLQHSDKYHDNKVGLHQGTQHFQEGLTYFRKNLAQGKMEKATEFHKALDAA